MTHKDPKRRKHFYRSVGLERQDCTTVQLQLLKQSSKITRGGGESFVGGSEMKRENEIMEGSRGLLLQSVSA